MRQGPANVRARFVHSLGGNIPAMTLRSLKTLNGAALNATDGLIGRVESVLFDDWGWTVRYLLVDTGNWLSGRLVLISPEAVDDVISDNGAIAVRLTRRQVEESPPVETDAPVSLQSLTATHDHYGWPAYWAGWPAFGMPLIAPPSAMTDTPGRDMDEREDADPHLHSAREVIGYRIHARDDEVGHVDDLIADVADWTIRYLIVDTRNWLPGRKVIVSPRWVNGFSYADQKAYVDLGRAEIEKSPEFDPAAPVNREYEERLFDYYGRPAYWDDAQ